MKGIGKTIRRRRAESKTDYGARIKLLAGNIPRVVVRRTNRYLIVQLVTSSLAQDTVVCSANSKELLGLGWNSEKAGSLKNRAAAYLTGLLLARRAQTHSIKNAILDLGMQRNMRGGRLYAVLKGVSEGGVSVPHQKDALPEKIGDEKQITLVKEKIHHGK